MLERCREIRPARSSLDEHSRHSYCSSTNTIDAHQAYTLLGEQYNHSGALRCMTGLKTTERTRTVRCSKVARHNQYMYRKFRITLL